MTRDEIHEKLFGEKIDHHLVTVFNWEDFEEWVGDCLEREGDLPDKTAIIEIYTSPGKPVLSEDYLSRKNVIALDFEDYPEDVDFPQSSYHPKNPTIRGVQCVQLLWFIKEFTELGYDFVIHCGAGVSRSQQVAEFILLYTHHRYVYDEEKSSHDHYFFQTIVLSRLLEWKHKIFPDFENKDDFFRYDEETQRWIPRVESED